MEQTGRRMIPYSKALMESMFAQVAAILLEQGLLESRDDEETFADDVLSLLRAHGHLKDNDEIVLGRFILLPSQPPEVSLLLASPLPVDLYDDELHRKPSPVHFGRTPSGQIVFTGRMMLTVLEDLASNPAASDEMRALFLNYSRCAPPLGDIALPLQVETVALPTETQDIVEAILPGWILTVDLDTTA